MDAGRGGHEGTARVGDVALKAHEGALDATLQAQETEGVREGLDRHGDIDATGFEEGLRPMPLLFFRTPRTLTKGVIPIAMGLRSPCRSGVREAPFTR